MTIVDRGVLTQLEDGALFPERLDAVVRVLLFDGKTMEPSTSDPSLLVRMVVRDRRPVVVQATVVHPDLRELTAADLRFWSLPRTADSVVREVRRQVDAALNPPPPLGSDLAAHAEWGRHNATVGDVSVRRRRPVTVERLREAATVYLADGSGKPTEAVQRALHVSHSTAARLVGQARRGGLIPPYNDRRKGAKG